MKILDAIRIIKEDFSEAFSRDPAARNWAEVILCYPGLHAVLVHRASHFLWLRGLKFPARLLSHIARALTGVEIHPGATIGRRFFIDHGSGVVIGETSEIGDDVVLYQGVTLGGVSLSKGKRHPTVGDRVIVGAGSKILGPVTIGSDTMIGAGSVVVKDVPSGCIAVGVPAKVISKCSFSREADSLRHDRISDPLVGVLGRLEERVRRLEKALAELSRSDFKDSTDIESSGGRI